MNITVEKLPNCMASVRVEVPGDTRKAEREKILSNYTQHAALPGFRKGKAAAQRGRKADSPRISTGK